MKSKLSFIIFSTLACSISVFAQTNNTGRFNWFPNQGNVGIGTRTPSKDLEVIGDLNVTGATTSGSIQTTSLQSGNLLNLNNTIINGKLGIGGVPSPTEALDVLGNLKLSGNITAQGVNFQTLSASSGTFGSLTVSQNVNVGGNIVLTNNLSALGITSSTVNTQTLTAGLATFNDNVTFTKNIFLGGKLGIGVAQPNELLEVGGNIKSTGILSSQSITTGTAQLTSLSVNQNSTFSGLVGIGTNTPGEKLHVAGNIKADNTITSSALNATNVQAGQLNSGAASFTDKVSVSKDVIVSGKLGIGVEAPSESLDIIGNLKLSGSVNAAALNANQGSFPQGLTAGNTSVLGTLNVTGQLTAQSLSLSDINATNNASIGNGLTVTGQSQLNGGAAIGGTSTVNDLKVNGTLNAKSIAISDLNTTGSSTIGQDLNVTGKAQIGSDLTVNGQLNAQDVSLSSITSTGNISVGNGLTVTGASQLNGGASVTGDMSVNGLLTVGTLSTTSLSINDLTTSGNATISQNLSVTGGGQVGGDFAVGGNFNAGVITATEFKKADGSPLINLDNAVVSQTLNVSADHVPDNYKMAVGGNIIAAGIDIKIPQNWPDYVFTDGHKLLTIEEVQQFVEQHGHLPGVPSAKEMESKKNYSVSEMDAKLLEKVEELTLYIFELKKEIDALKKK